MLNKAHFKVIAGQANVDSLTANTQDGLDLGMSLSETQEKQFKFGYRGAELSKNVQGWVLRSDTGLDGFITLAGSGKGWSYGEAVEAAKRWFMGDAEHRYVFVRR